MERLEGSDAELAAHVGRLALGRLRTQQLGRFLDCRALPAEFDASFLDLLGAESRDVLVVQHALQQVATFVVVQAHAFELVTRNQLELIRTKWAEKGMTEAQMEQAEAITRKFMGPVVSAIATPFMVVLFGLIISLVLAAILKRNPPADAPSVASA